jgi:PAS domain S-box-containing protein
MESVVAAKLTAVDATPFWEAAPDAFLVLGPDLAIGSANPAASRLFRAEPEAMVGESIHRFLAMPPGFREELQDVLRTGVSLYNSDIPILYPDGDQTHVSLKVFPVPDGLGLIVLDVTEFRRLIEDTASFSRFLQHVIASANVCLHVVDRNLQTVIWNRAAEQLTGFRHEDVLGTLEVWRLLFPEAEARAETTRRLEQVLAGEPAAGQETRLRTKAGETVFVSWHWQRILDEERTPVGAIGIGVDTTSHRHLQDQLLMAQKMDAIGTLAGGVAHDFNNLLTAIFGNTDLAISMIDPPNPVIELLEEVMATTRRATGLTRQLLLFSRKQQGNTRAVNLNETIRGMLKMLGRLLGENMKIATDLAPDLPAILGDEGHLEQVLLNLCINARDAMPEGGQLWVITRCQVLSAAAAAQLGPQARTGEFVRLQVRDSGCGIRPEILHRIFEPFFTTKGPGRGTGLGLAVVYGVIKELDGWITVASTVGEGTEFSLYIPAHLQAAAQTAAEDRGSATGRWRSRGESVLVVEDDELVNQMLTRVLAEAGFKVESVTDVAAALQRTRERAVAFDLTISDVVLPDGNGFSLVQDLLARKATRRVLVITGYADRVPPEAGIATGLVRYLQKPFPLDVFTHTVDELLNRTAESETPSGMG